MGIIYYASASKGFLIAEKEEFINKKLRGKYVHSVLEDEEKKLWFETNKGLFMYDPATIQFSKLWTKTVKHLTSAPELQLRGFENSDNAIAFLGNDGAIRILKNKKW